MLDKNLLPIGTVVKINGVKLMIYGYLAKSQAGSLSQYFGCAYPIGMTKITEGLCFNNDEIDEILYMGYKSQDYDNRMNKYKADYFKFVDNYNKSYNELMDTLLKLGNGIDPNEVLKEIQDKKSMIDVG